MSYVFAQYYCWVKRSTRNRMKLKTFVRSSESLDMRFFADVDVVGVAGAMLDGGGGSCGGDGEMLAMVM